MSDISETNGAAGPDAFRQVKVLTVSDGVIAGTREDKSGQQLEEFLGEQGWSVIERRQVADGVESVSSALTEMSDGFVGLVVTTGGTGFGAPRSHPRRHAGDPRTTGAGYGRGNAAV